MPRFARRFRIAAGSVAVGVVLLVIAAVIALAFAVPALDVAGTLILLVVGVAVLAGLVVAAIAAVRRQRALREVAARHPGAVVFLARRQPSLVSDLSVYLGARGISADVADRWLIALVDERGISAWSIGSAPVELLLMPWGELGAVEVTDLEAGGSERGIAVDVRPFDTPLIVAIGYAAFGIMASLGREGVAEVCRLTNAQRPAA